MKSTSFAESNRALEKALCAGIILTAPHVARFGQACQQFDDVVKRNYKLAGAPYGDSMEGRYRWLNECGAIVLENQQQREEIADAKLMLTLRAFFS